MDLLSLDITQESHHALFYFEVAPQHQNNLMGQCRALLPVLSKQPGFLGAALFQGYSYSICCLVQWRSSRHHQVFMQSRRVAANTRHFMEFLENFGVTMRVEELQLDSLQPLASTH